MAETVQLVDPARIDANPENPRLIFRADELDELQESIRDQGILVPLTVYQSGRRFVLLDGERRWRCAIKLGLETIPVIVQPRPDRLQNLMMMFAIHNTRRDWDPLPAALKLQDLEQEFLERQGRRPTETELAGLASIGRGEVRRLRNLLALPERYREELLKELEKPRSEQILTVDHVLETTRGAAALRKRGVVDGREEERLRRSILRKFRAGVIENTVAPRQLARIGRAIDRDEVSPAVAKRVAHRLIEEPDYTIEQAFDQSVARIDFEHGVEQLSTRLVRSLAAHQDRGYELGDALRSSLSELRRAISQVLRH
jgi:ParB/RepB/Spo0J family partition protein